MEIHFNELLPKENTKDLIIQLLDQISQSAFNNIPLHDTLTSLSQENLDFFEILFLKIQNEGQDILPHAIAYAFVLEPLTKLMVTERRLITDITNMFDNVKSNLFLLRYFSFFEYIKSNSLDNLRFSAEIGHVTNIDLEKPSPNTLRTGVFCNILEATITEFFYGSRNNAYTGWILASHPIGGRANSTTHSGPASYGYSNGLLNLFLSPPLPKDWKNLYTLWNIAFVTNFKS